MVMLSQEVQGRRSGIVDEMDAAGVSPSYSAFYCVDHGLGCGVAWVRVAWPAVVTSHCSVVARRLVLASRLLSRWSRFECLANRLVFDP